MKNLIQRAVGILFGTQKEWVLFLGYSDGYRYQEERVGKGLIFFIFFITNNETREAEPSGTAK